MIKYEVIFLEPAKFFLDNIDKKSREKILFNIWKSREKNDPSLFRKLTNDIWEFRTRFKAKQFKLLAFWDKESNISTLVIATHGFFKKTQKIPKREIEKAEQLRREYFENIKLK
ncbi:MAG: type II toxin-antitoxin system RelE/ParE family toxin [Bacteroidales bacterium]|nr:type II toxin-antitoxin system RelE/ParE family toxin [Bacteroidales bacterium]